MGIVGGYKQYERSKSFYVKNPWGKELRGRWRNIGTGKRGKGTERGAGAKTERLYGIRFQEDGLNGKDS